MKLKRPEIFHGFGANVLGVYAITDALEDSETITRVKIGFSTDLVSRLNSYHTSFPNGFWMLQFILVEPLLADKFDKAMKAKVCKTLEGMVLLKLQSKQLLTPARPRWTEWLADITPSELEKAFLTTIEWAHLFFKKEYFRYKRPPTFLHSFHNIHVDGAAVVRKIDIKDKLPDKATPKTTLAAYYGFKPIERDGKRKIQRPRCLHCS